MAENTAIEWADHTFNPWVGCTKVSPGCDHCYAESWARRAGKAAGVTWGGDRRRTSDENWEKPLRWNAEAEREGRRFRVFCASLADVFDNQVPAEWREDLFDLIANTPHLDWLLLTKRIGNAEKLMRAALKDDGPDWPWDNLWLGVTVVNQAEADRDVPKLLAVQARVRFLSIEPMLGPIDLTRVHERRPGGISAWHCLQGYCQRHFPRKQCGCDRQEPTINWVICGGESGPGARPMHPDWARSLRDQCAAAGVPFLFKQWGEWAEHDAGPPPHAVMHMDSETGQASASACDGFISKAGEFVRDMDDATTDEPYRGMVRVGKKAAGRQLDGRTHDEFPA
jgi:protein gp37